jgi:hypothetical protein
VSVPVITLCVASQIVFIVDFVIDLVRKLLDTPSFFLSIFMRLVTYTCNFLVVGRSVLLN